MPTHRKLKKLIRDPKAFFGDAVRNRVLALAEAPPGSAPPVSARARPIGAVQEHLLAARLLNDGAPKPGPALRRVYVLTHVPYWRNALGNQRRITELVDHLGRHFDVTVLFTGLITFYDAKLIARDGRAAEVVPLVTAGCALAWESEDPAADHRDRKAAVLRDALARLVAAHPCRAIVSEYILTEPLTRGLDLGCHMAIDVHDIMSKRMETYAAHGRDHHIRISREEEIHLLSRFDTVVAIQGEEHADLDATLGAGRTILCPHPVHPEPMFKDREPRRLVYVAGTNPANVDSMEWFLSDVWPRLGDLGLELHVFGTVADRLRRHPEASGRLVRLHGPVAEVRDVYVAGDIVINPVLYGGGLKIKTVEAMGYGLPQVTTREGAAGLSDLAGRAFLVADDPSDFAAAIRTLAQSPALRRSLSEAAIEAAGRQFSPEACFAPLVGRIEAHRPRVPARPAASAAPATPAIRETLLVMGQKDFPLIAGIRPVFDRFARVRYARPARFGAPAEFGRRIAADCIDRVFFVNPYTNAGTTALYRWCREAGVPYLCFDRGGLPDSWFFDPSGFNADSASYAPDRWAEPPAPDRRRATEAYLAGLRAGSDALEVQGARRGGAALRKALGVGKRRRMLFVPFQRPDDAVVRHFSGAAGGFDGFCRMVAELGDLLGPGWEIVGKAHPLERDTPDLPIRFADPGVHVHDLIEASDAVFTLNSGVGLIALGFGRPTFVAGEAYYAHPGLARGVSSAADLAQALGAGETPEPDAVMRFYDHLLHEVYSFGPSEGYLRTEADGRLSRITTGIAFATLRLPGVPEPDGAASDLSVAAE